MEHIAIFGTTTYFKKSSIISLLAKLKKTYGPKYLTINTSGNQEGADPIIKKISLELGFYVKEYNPSYTGYHMYSAESREYYGKSFHISHIYHRYNQLFRNSTKIIIFAEKSTHPELKIPMGILTKYNIPIIIIN